MQFKRFIRLAVIHGIFQSIGGNAALVLEKQTEETVPLWRECSTYDDEAVHPVLCHKVKQLLRDPVAMSQDLYNWAEHHNLLIKPSPMNTSYSIGLEKQRRLRRDSQKLGVPIAVAHGMGDSCFNEGIQHVTERMSRLLSDESLYTNVTCIPMGNTQTQDTNSGYFLNMDASVDLFATHIRNDPQYRNGFQALGFSQGNNLIRGYIAKYNDPPVHSFISINGVNAGEGAVPYCRPTASVHLPSICDLLMEQASRAAYTEYAQQHSFQANYWRDPRPSEFPTYQQFSQLARWNNEVANNINQTLRENWSRTEKFIWVLAKQDHMVWPPEGEQWGAPDPDHPFSVILPRNQTAWYQRDLFGLRTAEEQGKNYYEQFDGDHLQFEWDDFDRWITTYFKSK
jgi:palmitoyl-protein thioesterase